MMKHKMVEFPLLLAKVSVQSAIEDVLRNLKNEYYEIAREDVCQLNGVMKALVPIFGRDWANRVFDATNYCDCEDIDVNALRAVLAELDEKYPDSECFMSDQEAAKRKAERASYPRGYYQVHKDEITAKRRARCEREKAAKT